MPLPPAIESFLHENITLLVGVLIVVTPLQLLLIWVLAARLGKLTRLYRKLTQGTSGGNLEERLVDHVEQVRGVDDRIAVLQHRIDCLADAQRRCLQHVGVVRYDAFEEVGGEQSFSIALTDAERNGAVLSSVHSRTDVRVYAKALENGRSTHPLSIEEQRAITAAESN